MRKKGFIDLVSESEQENKEVGVSKKWGDGERFFCRIKKNVYICSTVSPLVRPVGELTIKNLSHNCAGKKVSDARRKRRG